MIDPIGNLFPDDFNYGLPFIKGMNIRFVELFIGVAFLKALNQKNRFQSTYYKQYQFLLLLTIVLLIFTIFQDSNFFSIFIVIKWLFVWSLLYSIPKLINTFDEWTFLFRMSFIIVFIGLLSQILHLALGHPPSYLLGTNFSPIMDYGDVVLENLNPNEYDITEARPVSSISIMQTAIVGAMFFLQFKRKIFSENYLFLIIIIAYVSIIFTATRGWFIAFTVVLFLYFVFINKIRKLGPAIVLVLILIPTLLSIPIIQKQFEGAMKRFSTISAITQGDLSAGGTSGRDEYSVGLYNLWKESPLFGWGFTDFYKKNGNGHAGLANLLFGVGIVGYLVFIYFWYKLFFVPISTNKRLSNANPFKGTLYIFTLGFLIFFILNATSGQQFGIYLGFGSGIFSQVLFYSYSSFFIITALNTEKEIKELQGGNN